MKVVNFVILESLGLPQKLEGEVRRLLEQGWELRGDLIVTAEHMYIQVMIRYERGDDNG